MASSRKKILLPEAYIVGEKLMDNDDAILPRNINTVKIPIFISSNENIINDTISPIFIANINIGIYTFMP